MYKFEKHGGEVALPERYKELVWYMVGEMVKK